MKKMIFFSTSAAVALLTTSLVAQAADLPTKAYVPAPVMAQVYNWTGFYVGVNGGYGWGTQDPLTLFSNRFDRTSFNINGGMFGGTIGAKAEMHPRNRAVEPLDYRIAAHAHQQHHC